MNPPIPRIRIRATARSFRHAKHLVHEILTGEVRLGFDAGAEYVERLDGFKFIAYRLECGGVDVREVTA